MDLHLRDAAPTEAERAAIDGLLEPASADLQPAPGGAHARAQRHLLLPALQAVSDAVGWVSEGALNEICRRLTVPPADAHGVLSFYALLSDRPRPARVAHVCDDLACQTAGAEELAGDLEAQLGPAGVASDDGTATWERSPCLGLCDRAPAVWAQRAGEPDAVAAPALADDVRTLLDGGQPPATPPASLSVPQADQPAGADLPMLGRVGRVDPESLDAYRAAGGFEVLRRAVDLGPDGVLRELTDSELAGRGGAAFPTGVKWRAVATAPGRPHYVVANADESEPGTFKDRVVLEQDPFAFIEAMIIAGYTTGSERGYVYLRGEYPLALARLDSAIAQCRDRGLLGADVLGAGFAFDLEVRRGAGAYICGEETALIESIEGKRGEPRNKPPFPTQVGLFGQPTAVNNVETLVAILDVLARGGPEYAARGSPRSSGTKLFCVSGCVARPGLYEVEFGVTVAELLELAGGIADGGELQAILLGGAAGTFLRPEQVDLPLTFEDAREAKQALGSGVVMVFDDRVDLPAMLQRIAAFFRDESCGQCVPCRVGTVRQEESLARLVAGGDPVAEVGLLDELARVMADASICGLGHTAPSALASAIDQQLVPWGRHDQADGEEAR